MIQKSYFKQNPQDPKPLKYTIERQVRFDELDPLNIMWHGNYASFFEEGRVTLGDKYSIGYLDFFNHGINIPLKKFHVDYVLPLEFKQTYKIETLLYWNEAARLDFEFHIYNQKDELMTTGYSIHLMIDNVKGILVAKPAFFEKFCENWKKGQI
ncbi:acyl-CoA thioesterase [Endomicrobium proavitum]|uniref:Thioesterase superfamily protein n=1 Tax=Endomicrobium proavitum TaxID=1408281 RepID=A0A0G3WLD3_9BACT|nr:acyl-CoA thioesterase [Endomicrobium proavitum]AKL98319.1 Thioesterase superfamily protein [Endomicrobium proavitum]